MSILGMGGNTQSIFCLVPSHTPKGERASGPLTWHQGKIVASQSDVYKLVMHKNGIKVYCSSTESDETVFAIGINEPTLDQYKVVSE